MGDKQYNITITTLPPRAEIYDRNGTVLAMNKNMLSAFILPQSIEHPEATSAFLKKYFPEEFQEVEKKRKKKFCFLKRNLSETEIDLIKNSGLKDIHILEEPSRFYPHPSTGTVIGITNIDNLGTLGLEQQYNRQLSGLPTTFFLKKDARSKHFYFHKETKEQGETGVPLTTTIDAQIQFAVQEIIDQAVQEHGAQEAAAVVMDPNSGDIIAMVSYPHFDPNDTNKLNMETTKNRPLSQAFETGSVIKIFAAVSALEEGVVTLDEMIDCESTKETKIEGIRVRTVIPNGIIPFLQVIQDSNNIGTVKVVKRVDKKLYDYYKDFGFGRPTMLGFPGEQRGFVNQPKNWSRYSIVSLSFGYEITTTLIQLARAYSIVINGEYYVQPRMNLAVPIKKQQLVYSQKTIQDARTILQSSIEKGTGKKAYMQNYKILGKTGTANIMEGKTYTEEKNLYTFIGSVEKENYQRVIAVYIRETLHKSYASLVAAPIFKKIAEAVILHERAL
jgi:cell division protein FtsI/penicillin-binding protein 2